MAYEEYANRVSRVMREKIYTVSIEWAPPNMWFAHIVLSVHKNEHLADRARFSFADVLTGTDTDTYNNTKGSALPISETKWLRGVLGDSCSVCDTVWTCS